MTDPFSLVIVAILTIGIIPTFLGILFRVDINKLLWNHQLNLDSYASQSVLKNISLGIMLALFVDFFAQSTHLGVQSGINFQSFGLLYCFIFGFIFTLFLSSLKPNYLYNSILLLAISFSFHSFAEGIVMSNSTSNNLGMYLISSSSLDSLILPVTSYVLHKFAEGFIIPLFYFLSPSSIVLFTLISGFPVIFGIYAGTILSGSFSSLLFAISSGSFLFIIITYIKNQQIQTENISDLLFIMLGFTLIYMAGLPHSI